MSAASLPDPKSHRTPRADNLLLLIWTLASLGVLIAWDAGGLDRSIAHWFGGIHGFPMRDQWFLVHVMHEGARRLAWLTALALVLAVWWPFGVLRSVSRAERLQLAVTTLLALAW
jgi:hypothetical protein